MKFAAAVRKSAEEVPDLQPLWQVYKKLKKRIPKQRQPGEDGAQDAGGEERAAFLDAVRADVTALNTTFLEREEVAIIRLHDLQDAADAALAACSRQEQEAAYKALVDLHGEVLLLLHWSILAYTALLKILKKARKRSGLVLGAHELGSLLGQPFCSVEVMSDMVRKAEASARALADALQINHELVADSARRVAEAGAGGSCMGGAGADSTAPACTPDRAGPGGCGGNEVAEDAAGYAAAGPSAACNAAPAAAAALAGHKRGREEGSSICLELAAAAGREARRAVAGLEAPGSSGSEASGSSSGAVASGSVGLADSGGSDGSGGSGGGSLLLRQTRAALDLWQQLVATASTPSTVFDGGSGAAALPGMAALRAAPTASTHSVT